LLRRLTFLITPLIYLFVGLMLIVALGVAQRIGWISAGGIAGSSSTEATAPIHTCPMHPQIRQPGPGSCPICGMPLVPAAAGGGAALDELSVKIEPAQRRLANIQTAKVERQVVAETIRTVGAIAIDESRMATISSYVDGRLERLFADYTGVQVAKRDHLAVVYSPELYSAQVEFLETRNALARMSGAALAAVREAQQKLLGNARNRLGELGMLEEQIVELEKSGKAQSRLTLYSPIGGTVIEKLAVEGKYIKAGEPIYRIADLSTVWLMLELYPEDAARIRYGQRVEAEMQSLPGELFNGRVAFVDRTVNQQKRTVGVRVEFLNDDGRLRPGDYANASIYVPIGQRGEVYDEALAGRWISPMHPQIVSDAPGKCSICGMDLVPTSRFGYADVPVKQPTSLSVPRSALLLAGANSVVYVETEPGRFEIRTVTLGPILRDRVVVLGGLQSGEMVATAGNFLIDSQMQLAGNPSLIDPTRAVGASHGRKSPLSIDDSQVTKVSGPVGEVLELLFDAYFRVQRSLAADRLPLAADGDALQQLAQSLSESDLSAAALDELETIAQHASGLKDPDIKAVRLQSFRPISHAVVRLSAEIRGEQSKAAFLHMFCPMVKGGGGDWLQADEKLVNPYWGAKMLHCGRVVKAERPEKPVKPEMNRQTTPE
jgi:multidrug efflux pump subunit AcrA (membrane-fusion protein)